MRRDLCVPIPLLAVAAFLVVAPAIRADGDVRATGAKQGAQEQGADELESLRRALAQPGGGEARREREAAVDALLRRREPEAHELLAAVIRRGDDPDETASYVLRSLGRTVAQPANTVFSDDKLKDIALRIYVPALVRLFADDESLAPPNDAAPLIPLARRVLAQLSNLDRRNHFQELVDAGNPVLARAALRAAGASRNISLVEWIAARLDDPELAPAARDALMTLTFAEQRFPDRAAFEAWYDDYRDLDYLELAERAAMRGSEVAERVRAEGEARVVAQTSKLIDALARAEAPDWKAIADEVLRAPSDVGTQAYLAQLRDALAEGVENGVKLGGAVQDRQAFAREIRLRLESLVDKPGAYAVHLETLAYLAVRDVPEQSEAVQGQLLESLTRPEPQVRRAAFRGLRRFPTVQNRARVVAAASEALATRDGETLREGLACLRAPGWTAPGAEDPDREPWLVLLRSVLDDTTVDLPLRERVLDIAVLRDASDGLVGEAFAMLLDLVRATDRDAALRKQALLRLMAFSRDPGHADAYVRCTTDLLADVDPGMRRLAAQQLTKLPEATQARRVEWNTQIVQLCAVRLREEPEEAVLREVLQCMLHASEQPDVTHLVLEGLVAAADAVAERSGSEEPFRRAVVVDGLRILGVSRARDTQDWLGAARSLAKLRARDALRAVLDRQNLAEFADGGGPDAASVMQLVIAAARLKPAERRWSELPEEAEQVRHAFDVLDRLGQPATTPADRALRVDVLAVLGRPAEVVDAAKAALDEKATPLSQEQTVAVLRVLVSADLELAAVDAAEECLQELEGLGAGTPADLDLWTRIARRRIASGSAARAAQILERVLDRTPVEEPSWRERFLLLAEARLEADPENNKAVVLKDLRAEAERFTGEGVPGDAASRYTALLRRAQGQG